jgi:hypothetical protein
MASAAVTAASAAVALVPFEMSLGCLPAKGDSRNFLIERPALLPSMMATTSLATVEALRWLAGASTRLTTAATSAENCGPVNRAHIAHSPTLKGRLGPKSTVFSASRLDSAVRKMAFAPFERIFHAF